QESCQLKRSLLCFGISLLLISFAGTYASGASVDADESLSNHVNEIQDDSIVSGTVTDADGEPIPGVTVTIEGNEVGTVTDLDGKYSLNVPENATLIFSFIGYKTQRIPVGDQSTVDVTFVEEIS